MGFNTGYMQSLRGTKLQAAIAFSSAWAFSLFGYDQGVLGGLIALPKFLGDNNINPNNANLAGTIVSLYDVGCLTGSIFAGAIGQMFGRRMFIVLGGVFLMAGAGLQAGAHGSTLLIVGRLIGGIGNGLNTTMVPIWVAETAKASNRGILMSCQMVLVITGLTIAYWFDFGMFHHHPNSTAVWRLPLAFQGIFVIMNWCTIGLLPESPRYLYAKGHTEDADEVMARIYAVPVDSQALVKLRNDVLNALQAEKEYKFSLKDLFYDSSPVRSTWRLWLSALVQLWQQMDGNNLVSYYATYLFIHSLGMSADEASVTSGGVTLLFWGGMVTTVYTVEHFGRRAVMLWGAIFCTLFMVLFTIGLGVNNKASAQLAVTSIFLFQFSFGMSWANVSWVYSPEIVPLHLRHIGMAMATFTQWFLTFLIVKFGPIGIQQLGFKFYYIFCVTNVIVVFCVYFLVKETKGLSLEEIDVLFATKEYRHALQARISGDHEAMRKSNEI